MTDSEPLPDPASRIDRATGQTVVRATTADMFLRLVPMLVGQHPADSVVLVLFRGTRAHGAMRVDLPRFDDALGLKRWATSAIGLVCKVQGITGVAPVVYTPDTFAPDGRLPRPAVLRALDRRAGHAGLTVPNLLCVAADGWGSLRDPDLPRGGRPLAEIAPLPLDAYGAVHQPLREVPEHRPASTASVRAFWRAVQAWTSTVGGPLGADRLPLHGVDLRRPGSSNRAGDIPPAFTRIRFGDHPDALLDLVERMLEPHDDQPDSPCPCRALLYCLARRPGLPNLVLVQIGWGRDAAAPLWHQANMGDRGGRMAELLGGYLAGTIDRQPDADRIAAAIAVLRTVGAHVQAPSRPAVDAMLAWLYWALGAASVAGTLAERALHDDPGHELAQHVRLSAERLPEWAFGERPAGDPLALPA